MIREPYWQTDRATLWHGDCLDVLRTLDDASVDAVVTDPPYSSGGMVRGDRMAATSNKYRGWSQAQDGGSKKPESNYPDFTGDNRDQRGFFYWCALWLGECRRVLRPGGVVLVFTDWRQLPTSTDYIQAGGIVWRGVVVWDKGIGRPVKGRFRNHVEYVVWGSNGPMDGDSNPVYPPSVFRHTPPRPDDREHLTQKPVELLRDLMEIVKPGGVVLDPFAGSGTTGVAAIQTGRSFVGVEIDQTYTEIAKARIAKATEDGPGLFGGVA